MLYLLPFDHRGSFMRLIKASSPPSKKDLRKVKKYKEIIYSAYKKTIKDFSMRNIFPEDMAILVDEWLGKKILLDAKRRKIPFCYTLEKSGQEEFQFDRLDYKQRIRYFNPDYVKILIRYHPANRKINQNQIRKLRTFTNYIKRKRSKFLLEVVVPPTEKEAERYSKKYFDAKLRPSLILKVIKELQQGGINPDIWKLEGLDQRKEMQKVARQILAFNPQAGIVVLGRGESRKKARQWLETAAPVEGVIGFAVGRTIFSRPLQEYDQKKINQKEAISKIAKNYNYFINIFEQKRGGRNMKKVYLGSDHAGFKLKEKIKKWLEEEKIIFTDLGNLRFEKRDDYPDYAAKVAHAVVKEKTMGLLFCGSSEGVCIAANKIKGARAVNPCSIKLAKLAREHNDANIICLSGWYGSLIKSKKMIKTFLRTEFTGEERHLRRVNKIKQLEQ